jgi:4-hydroxy-3-methylbut-2-en-1-yl diphosphate reductase
MTDHSAPVKRLLLARPRGFCAGVVRAIEIVHRALDIFGPPVYVRKQIVHNRMVVDELAACGALFVESLEEVPPGAVCIFSAHGVAPAVRARAVERRLRTIDATCPLVEKVHREVRRFVAEGRQVVLVGHAGHEEVEGTMGEAPRGLSLVGSPEEAAALALSPETPVGVVTQTTLSIDDTSAIVALLRERFPDLTTPARSDICYATQNRQEAVKLLAAVAEVILVVGNFNSSNSRRLVEVAEQAGTLAYLVGSRAELRREWYEQASTVGLTSGASAPEKALLGVMEALREQGWAQLEEIGGDSEEVSFPLPERDFREEGEQG